MSSEIVNAIRQVCAEKDISYESVVASIEAALAAAYRKDFGSKGQNIRVHFDPETGASEVFEVKEVIADLSSEAKKYLEEKATYREMGELHPMDTSEDETEMAIRDEARNYHPKQHIQLSEALLMDASYEIGSEIKTKLDIPDSYGRMAAQTAKQVIIQKIREAERQTIFEEYKEKEGDVINATVQRKEGRLVFIDLGRTSGIVLPEDQVRGERYNAGNRIKVYVKSVNLTQKGPEILLSRSAPEIVKQLFMLEIPEIANGSVEIRGIAREAGSRTKISVEAMQENIDPIGSCVGQRGTRIQTIIQEIGGEKIDIIQYDENVTKYIANALMPAKIHSVSLNDENKEAHVKVQDDQLSLAIGKDGQNVRLASQLTGWKLIIQTSEGNALEKKESESEETKELKQEEGMPDNTPQEQNVSEEVTEEKQA